MAENRHDVVSMTSESGTSIQDILDSHHPLRHTSTVVTGTFRRMSCRTRFLSEERHVLFQNLNLAGSSLHLCVLT